MKTFQLLLKSSKLFANGFLYHVILSETDIVPLISNQTATVHQLDSIILHL